MHDQIPLFTQDTNGGNSKSKYVMGKRNWCSIDWQDKTGELQFEICVEINKGFGHTKGWVESSSLDPWARAEPEILRLDIP